jgi:hypothetical protein|tara:strand:+ start:8419 stop:8724 length:306 start_codon:yes stop_codon:yes gene_type:complete
MEIIGLKNLCTPSYVYLVISIILLMVMYFQNMNNTNIYCLGAYECEMPNMNMLFIIKILYILFWTWVLNIICKEGATPIAWLLILAPTLLFFVLLSLLFIS